MREPLYSLHDSHRINRRTFLAGTVSLAAAALWSARVVGAARRHPVFPAYPFSLGVASGDPRSDSVVLWTRLAPQPLDGGGMPWEPVEVRWQVAADENMKRVVRTGTTIANPDWAHSVHVEVDGLQPDRWYWYQFKAGAEVSPIGRTRTMPQPEAEPARLLFAFASCQHYETGLYTAYEHMAREDLDLILHLGDYIYEQHAVRIARVRDHETTVAPITLADYRNRFARYKTDPALQAAHLIAPWIVTWDDHELENNYAGEHPEEKSPLQGEAFLRRRAAAYQAYYEHMPLRRSSLPTGPDMQLYRRQHFGRLAAFHVLDTRQYRSDQVCGDRIQPPCPEAEDPRRTLLGAEQRAWLAHGLEHSSAAWNVLAQQVMMARIDYDVSDDVERNMDTWAGYESERRFLLRHLHERKIANAIVLTGDDHRNWANDLIADFDDLEGTPVAVEFIGTSISSGQDGQRQPRYPEAFFAQNPFVKFYNTERGYVTCEVTNENWRTDFKTVETVVRPGAPLRTRASFVVEPGRPVLQRA